MKKSNILILSLLIILLTINIVSAQGIDDLSDNQTNDNTQKTNIIKNTMPPLKQDTNTFYASPAGKSTNNGSSQADAWDINTAIKNMQTKNNTKLILADGTYLITKQLEINNTHQIQAQGNAILDANQTTNILKINSNSNIQITNITFQNAKTSTNGSAIYNEGKLEIENCTFINNEAFYQRGGTIYNKETLKVSNTLFEQNKAQYGGAIYNDNGNLYITNNTFQSNNAYSSSGGAIYNDNIQEDKIVDIISNQFINNTCEFNGGGVLYNNGRTTLKDNQIKTSYGLHGGAIYNLGDITIQNNTFENNTSSNGPVIYNMATAILINNTLINNNASVKGGAIYNMANMTITDNTISSNHAPTGGAIYNALGQINLQNNNITNNNAKNTGGAIYNQADMIITNNLIENNTAATAGAIYNQHNSIQHTSMDMISRYMMQLHGNITATNNTFKDNKESFAKEIYNKGEMTIDNNTFISTNNTQDAIIYNDEYDYEEEINAGLITINNNTFKNINKIAQNNGTMIFTNNTLINTTNKHIENNSNLTYYNNTIINTLNITINIDTINAYYRDNITINATFTDEIGNNVNVGRAIFKLNGITYKNQDNTKYINITDGKASINYTVNKSFKNITVIYEKNSQYSQQINTTDNITVKYKTAEIKLTLNQTKAKSTNTIKIKAEIMSNNTPVTGGKVIFKLNGKTLKDNNNNTIYVQLVNSTAILDYRLPNGLKSNNYTITAVYANDEFNRIEKNTTITIEKLDTIIKIDPIKTRMTTNATLKATLYDEYQNIINKTQKLVVKLNGIKIAYVVAVNGIINEKIPTSSYKKDSYALTLTVGTTYRYNSSTQTTTLILTKT